jgi:hypothetical protein
MNNFPDIPRQLDGASRRQIDQSQKERLAFIVMVIANPELSDYGITDTLLALQEPTPPDEW